MKKKRNNKKIKKRTVFIAGGAVLSVLIVLCAVFAVSLSSFGKIVPVAVIGGERIPTRMFSAEGETYLCIQKAAANAVVFDYDGIFPLYVNGKKYGENEGSKLSGRADISLRTGLVSRKVTLLNGSELPSMYIDTQSGSMKDIHADKEYKESARLTLVEDGTVSLCEPLDYVKGRGNLTWTAEKKPYNIKFEKKTELLGMEAAKKWSLLSQPSGFEYLNNPTAFYMASLLGMQNAPACAYVQLYLNGDYAGLYLVTEKTDVGKTSVDIHDLEEDNEQVNPGLELSQCALGGAGTENMPDSMKWTDIPVSPGDISGGYLLELDRPERYAQEPCGFVTPNGQPVVIKSPEYASRSEAEFISSYYAEMEEAVYSPDGRNSLGRCYADYLDMDSFAACYLVNEFFMNIETGISSTFISLDRGDGAFRAGPVWDFDFCFGEGDDVFGSSRSVSGTFAAVNMPYETEDGRCRNTFFYHLWKHSDFRQAVYDKYRSVSRLAEDMTAFAGKLSAKIAEAVRYDELKNDFVTEYGDDPSAADYTGKLIFCDRINGRAAAFDKHFHDKAAYLYYYAGEGEGELMSEFFCLQGNGVTVKDFGRFDEWFCPPEGKTSIAYFAENADGSGKKYYPGDEIILNKDETALYAVWK